MNETPKATKEAIEKILDFLGKKYSIHFEDNDLVQDWVDGYRDAVKKLISEYRKLQPQGGKVLKDKLIQELQDLKYNDHSDNCQSAHDQGIDRAIQIIEESLSSVVQGKQDPVIERGIQMFRDVQMASKVELILKPEYENTVFTWHQIKEAILSSVGQDRQKGEAE